MVQHADIDHTGIAGVTGVTPGVYGRYIRSGGAANYTTSSTSFVDVDSTNMSFTRTTGAHPVLCIAHLSAYLSSNAGDMAFDVSVDGTRLGGAFGLVYANQHATAVEAMNFSFSVLTPVLTAGSHTFKLQWRIGNAGHVGTLFGDAGGVDSGFHIVELIAE